MFGAIAVVATLALALVATGCGDDDEEPAAAAETDGAFIAEMTMHHESAIGMAAIAQERAQHKQVRELADAIVAAQGEAIIDAQSREIEEMNAWRERWYGALSPAGGVPPADESEAPPHEKMGH